MRQMPPETEYQLTLHFAELEDIQPGAWVFDVRVGDRVAIEALDVAAQAGSGGRTIVRPCRGRAQAGTLRISLTARQGRPILSGLEIIATPAPATRP